MQWLILFKKEMIENWRNKKWVWVPLVIILLAIIDPISNYYMPQIIESVGGFPDGTVLEFPEFAPPEAVLMSLGQLSSLGILVIVFMSMGTISGERKSGVSELILVKPVSHFNYITAKWTALLVLVWVSLFLGMLVSWYYTNILFGDLSFTAFLLIVFFYGLWYMLVITLVIFYNTLFKNPGMVAFFTILTIMIMSIITQIFGHVLEWSPNNLTDHILKMLMTEDIPSQLVGSAGITIAISAALLVFSVIRFKNKAVL